MSTSIKRWNADEMPREKFLLKGAESLSDTELIAILLRSGTKHQNVIDLARSILSEVDNNLGAIRYLTFDDLKKFKGMGQCKIVTLLAIFEIIKRIELTQQPQLRQIYSSDNAAKIISPILKDLKHEECWILYLNRGNRLISKERLTVGGISATVVDIKLIIKSAIAKLASSIILVHNHPSGNRSPGEEDKMQTKKLKQAAATCDIILLDHLIIAGNNYFSFNDEGLL